MSNIKKYVLTAVTLGLIAMGSGLLISGTYLLTKDPIAENKQLSINAGLNDIFKEEGLNNIYASKGEELVIDKKNNPYVTTIYYVYNGTSTVDEENTLLGYACLTDGYNDYGRISLVVGFNTECAYKNLYVVTNEQSFASKLKKEYITPLKNGERELDKVSCGATYGATTIKDMVNNSKAKVEERFKK